LLASALLSLGPTSVFAADLSLTPPPLRAPLPALFTWTGLYFGINGGYGWGRVNTVNQDGNTLSFNANGGLIGATLGFNYQWNWFVAGVEGDVDASGMHWKQASTSSSNAFLGLPQTAAVTLFYKNTVLSTVAARIGVAANRTLFYAKAGGAWTEEKYEFNGSDPVLGDLSGSNTINRLGWTRRRRGICHNQQHFSQSRIQLCGLRPHQ
jgi:outer membrane immunogenic protein